MNILILGGAGFLGKNLEKKLSQKHNIFIVDCIPKSEENYFNISLSQTQKLIDTIEANKIQIIIHLISTLLPSSFMEQYLQDIQSIYCPSVKLLDYCAKNKIKIIYFSSGGAVYGNNNNVFMENMDCNPVSFYGLSKLNFENLIKYYHITNSLNYLIIRPSNPYGYGQNIFGKQGLIAVIIGKIQKNEKIQIWGNGSAIKDYIFIDDFVFYISSLIEKDIWNNTFNIGSGIGSSINDVLNAFRQNSINLPEIEYIAEKQTDVKRSILDCSKIQKLIDYQITPLTVGIKDFWNKVNKN